MIYQNIPGTSYSLGLVLDERSIMALVYSTLKEYVLLLAVSLLVIIFIGIALVSLFAKPVGELIVKLSDLGRGINVERGVNSKTKELQILSDAIFDLYEKVNAQSATMRLERERFELIAQGSNDGIWEWGLENDMVFL